MKKQLINSLLVVMFSIFLIPSIALASWWNPLSWSIFHRTDTKTEVLENRINELEKKLANTATPTVTVAPATTTGNVKIPVILTTPKKVETKTVIQTVKPPVAPVVIETITPQPTVPQLVTPTVDLYQMNTNLISALTDLEGQVKTIITNKGYTSTSGLSGSDYINATNLNSLLQKIDARLYDVKSTNPSQENINYYTTQYNTLLATFKSIGISIPTPTPYNPYNAYLNNVQAQQDARHNSSECISAKSAYDNATNAIQASRRQQQKEIDAISNTSGITTGQAEQQKNAVNSRYASEQADLSLTLSSAMGPYYSFCEGVNSVPRIYNTNCYSMGNSINCSTY